MKQDIRDLSQAEMEQAFAALGMEKFRAKQVHEWLWKKSAQAEVKPTAVVRQARETMLARMNWPEVPKSLATYSATISPPLLGASNNPPAVAPSWNNEM